MKHSSSVACTNHPSVHRFAPWLANPPGLQEEWRESGSKGPQSLQQAQHDSLRIPIVNDNLRSAPRLKQTLFVLGYSETLVAYSGKRALAAAFPGLLSKRVPAWLLSGLLLRSLQ